MLSLSQSFKTSLKNSQREDLIKCKMRDCKSSVMHAGSGSTDDRHGGMGTEYLRYHSQLAELIAIKKGEKYAKAMSWITSRISFAP